MKKIVINKCYGGFGLSDEATKYFCDKKKIPLKKFYADYDIRRDDPLLVKIVETFGRKANGTYAELEIVEIPDDVKWEISEYDGLEHIAEQHRTW